MNFDRLRYIAERTELGERKKLFCCDHSREKRFIPEFLPSASSRNITEFNYRASDASAAQVFVGISLKAVKRTSRYFWKHSKLSSMSMTYLMMK